MAKDKLYYEDEDFQETLDDEYNTTGFYPDIGWNSDAQEQDEIYYPDEDYSEVEPVIVPVAQPTGKKDKEGRYGKNAKATNRQNGRKK